MPREPAPKRDVPGAEDVAVELDANEGIRARVTQRAQSGRRIREVRVGVGSVAEGAALERAPRRERSKSAGTPVFGSTRAR